METEKNRFSQLLEQLMNLGEIKNAALAKALQYDVSYISKWVSGRMLPAEKNKRNVLKRIGQELVRLSSQTGKENLFENYQVWNDAELEEAILTIWKRNMILFKIHSAYMAPRLNRKPYFLRS